MLTNLVMRGHKDGTISPRFPPEQVSRLIFCCVLGLRVMMKAIPSPETLRPMIDTMLETLA